MKGAVNMNRKIVLYGFGGPEDNYRVVRYSVLYHEEVSIRELTYQAKKMSVTYRNIRSVYAVDNRYGLYRDYKDAVKSNSMEGWVLFKDICEREGLEV